MKRILIFGIFIILLSGSCYAFFFGFGTSSGVDQVIQDGQNKGIIPATPNFKKEMTYWSKLEGASDITSPQVGPAGTLSGAPTYVAAMFGMGASCMAVSTGWYVPADSILNKFRGCIEFWYKPNFGMPVAVSITHVALGDNSPGLAYCDIYLMIGGEPIPSNRVRFAMRRGSDGDGWVYADGSCIWAANGLVHLALVWDVAGFKVSSTTYFQAIYRDGTFVAGSTDSDFKVNWTSSYINFGYSTDVLSYADGILDNLKIYNYGKTDFSDRNTE